MKGVLVEELALIMTGGNQQEEKDLVHAEEPSRRGQRTSGIMEKISFLFGGFPN